MLNQGNEILYNGKKYVVVTPIVYNGVPYYFVINIDDHQDYFFCQYNNGNIIPIIYKEIQDALLDEYNKKINR